MRKPKLTIGQICYFAMFCRNRESKTESFTVHFFSPIHALHHWIHKKNTYVANEDEVFYDFRDAVSDSHDFLQIQADSMN